MLLLLSTRTTTRTRTSTAADGDAAVCKLHQSGSGEISAIQKKKGKKNFIHPTGHNVTMTECVQHVCQASRTARLLLFQLHLITAAICMLAGVHIVCTTAEKHCGAGVGAATPQGTMARWTLNLGKLLINDVATKMNYFFLQSFPIIPIPTHPRWPSHHLATCHACTPPSFFKVSHLIVPPVAPFNYSLGVRAQAVAADVSSISRKFGRAVPPLSCWWQCNKDPGSSAMMPLFIIFRKTNRGTGEAPHPSLHPCLSAHIYSGIICHPPLLTACLHCQSDVSSAAGEHTHYE